MSYDFGIRSCSTTWSHIQTLRMCIGGSRLIETNVNICNGFTAVFSSMYNLSLVLTLTVIREKKTPSWICHTCGAYWYQTHRFYKLKWIYFCMIFYAFSFRFYGISIVVSVNLAMSICRLFHQSPTFRWILIILKCNEHSEIGQ